MCIEVYANKFLEKVVKSYGFLKPFSLLFQALYKQYSKVKALYRDLMS